MQGGKDAHRGLEINGRTPDAAPAGSLVAVQVDIDCVQKASTLLTWGDDGARSAASCDDCLDLSALYCESWGACVHEGRGGDGVGDDRTQNVSKNEKTPCASV